MSDKKFAIELTEREWDHIQIAMEESIVQLVKIAARRAMDSLPYSAVARSADRFEVIADKIRLRIEEESEERMFAEWKLEDEFGGSPGVSKSMWGDADVHTEES